MGKDLFIYVNAIVANKNTINFIKYLNYEVSASYVIIQNSIAVLYENNSQSQMGVIYVTRSDVHSDEKESQ